MVREQTVRERNPCYFGQASVMFRRGFFSQDVVLRLSGQMANGAQTNTFRQASVLFRRDLCFAGRRATSVWPMANGAQTNIA